MKTWVFVTNQMPNFFKARGILGLAPCPNDIKKQYSFGYNLAAFMDKKKDEQANTDNSHIRAVEWVMNKTNNGVESTPNGWLHINEGAVTSAMVELNDLSIDTFAANKQLNIKTDGEAFPTITSVPVFSYSFKLGRIIRETMLENSLTVYGKNVT